jgi:hypothetical protein
LGGRPRKAKAEGGEPDERKKEKEPSQRDLGKNPDPEAEKEEEPPQLRDSSLLETAETHLPSFGAITGL